MNQSNNPSRQNSDSATADTGTSTQVQVRNISLGHTAVSARSVAAPSVTASDAIIQNARDISLSSDPNFQNIASAYSGGTYGLEKLQRFVSFSAQLDSAAQDPDRHCHPGTRQNVLKRLGDWIDNPNAKERIFWLYGPAGAGKSAIAHTIARSYARPKVAATFFFFRSDVKRNDGNLLFPTLAYQLALSIPEIRDHIARSLSEHPDLPMTSVETQFTQLIARPFQSLSEDATQPSAPAADVIVEILKKYKDLAPVIVIDGLDECTDEKLQRRFLKIIGNAVTDDHFPLRFLIVSRPEAHIEDIIRSFSTPILTIDLAKLDDANEDIEKYLLDEFSRIASEQGLDPSWPGRDIVQIIVYKSSGNFIFASLVIRFVGDPDCLAETQLEIILNMKPPKTTTPFGVLDQLFLEILGCVPDQDFLRRYLALLTARISISSDLYQDDAVLMRISQRELHIKLRRMRPLLQFEPFTDVYHKSFLDFLHDPTRSGQYFIGNQSGIKRYLEVFVDSLVRYVSTVIEQPDHHNTSHFTPRFSELIKRNPQAIELNVEDWEQTLRPLLNALDKLLVPSNIDCLMDGYCQQCRFFQIAYDTLMHFKSLRKNDDPIVEKCLKSLGEIILYGNPAHQNFETNFRPVVFGSAAIVGILMAILAHQR